MPFHHVSRGGGGEGMGRRGGFQLTSCSFRGDFHSNFSSRPADWPTSRDYSAYRPAIAQEHPPSPPPSE